MSMATCARACQWMKSLSVLIMLTFLARILRVVGPGGMMRGSPHNLFLVGAVIGVWRVIQGLFGGGIFGGVCGCVYFVGFFLLL